MKQKVTLWYKQNNKTKEYEYNHLENNWDALTDDIYNKPRIISTMLSNMQNDWKNYKWQAKFCYLVNGVIECK